MIAGNSLANVQVIGVFLLYKLVTFSARFSLYAKSTLLQQGQPGVVSLCGLQRRLIISFASGIGQPACPYA